jgi:hypothetical protein
MERNSARYARQSARLYRQAELEDMASRGKPQRPKLVYFIQSASGPIKIGVAIDPRDRMRLIQSVHHEPLTLLGTAAGGRIREATLHAEFSRYRIRGEWFEPTPLLLARIAEMTGS